MFRVLILIKIKKKEQINIYHHILKLKIKWSKKTQNKNNKLK